MCSKLKVALATPIVTFFSVFLLGCHEVMAVFFFVCLCRWLMLRPVCGAFFSSHEFHLGNAFTLYHGTSLLCANASVSRSIFGTTE